MLYVCNEQSSDFTDITGVCSLDIAMRVFGPRANGSQIIFPTPLPGTADVSRWTVPSDDSTSSAEARLLSAATQKTVRSSSFQYGQSTVNEGNTVVQALRLGRPVGDMTCPRLPPGSRAQLVALLCPRNRRKLYR